MSYRLSPAPVRPPSLPADPARGVPRLRLPAWRAASDLHFVVLTSLLAAGLAVLDGPLLLRLPFGLLAVLILPGYGLATALLPRADDLEWIERLALAFGLSLAIITVLALGLNATPWGIRVGSIVLGLTVCTLLATAVAWWRRGRLDPTDRPSMTALLTTWRYGGRAIRLALALLIGTLALVGAALAVTLTVPPPATTEFFMLGPDGLAENYPRTTRPGEALTLTIGITNHEGAELVYRVLVETATNRLAEFETLALAPGETWQGPLTFALPHEGKDQQVQLLLFKESTPDPYRQLRLWIDVLPPAAALLAPSPAAVPTEEESTG